VYITSSAGITQTTKSGHISSTLQSYMAAKATGTHQAVEDCHLVLPNGVNHFVQPLRALGHFHRLGGQILQAAASCQHSKGPAELMLKPA
jgi:hypothetical protein